MHLKSTICCDRAIEAVYRSQGYYIDIENICRDKSDELSAKGFVVSG